MLYFHIQMVHLSIYFITIVQIRKKNLDECTTWTLATHSVKNREGRERRKF